MFRGSIGIPAVFALGLIVLASVVPAYASPYLTTSISQTGIKATSISGYSGVLVDYNDTSSTSFVGFVYLALVNSMGQTVYVNIGTCNFSAGHVVGCFVGVSPTVAAGTYSARVFATTTASVPVSATGSIQLTL